MSAKVMPASEGGTMVGAYVNEWCAIGTVPDKISFGEVPAPPAPKKTEVLVGVKAASINVDDVALLQDTGGGGWFYHTRKPSVKNPLVGGMDYAGVVLACGPDCTKIKVGDRVCGIIKVMEHQTGTWAEQTLVPEKEVCLIEDAGISFVDAAAVAMGAFVDFDMIKHAAKALAISGCRCLVLGASGALGTVMLQMLRKYKGHVTAVCSGANAEKVREMGADEVVDYTQQPFGVQLASAEKFNVVFDFVGGMEVQRGAEPLMESGGLYITAVGNRQNIGDRNLTCCEFTSSACSILRRALCGCGYKYKYIMSGAYPPLTAEIWKSAVIDSGARAAIAEEIPFAEAPLRAALKRVASHHPGGRVVMNLERRT
jgi:NADPH:quinone reductase-like Zn-dependent oxidoreductase